MPMSRPSGGLVDAAVWRGSGLERAEAGMAPPGGSAIAACASGVGTLPCDRKSRTGRAVLERRHLGRPGEHGLQRVRELRGRLVAVLGLLLEGLRQHRARGAAGRCVPGTRSLMGLGLVVTWSWMNSIGFFASNGSLPVSTS